MYYMSSHVICPRCQMEVDRDSMRLDVGHCVSCDHKIQRLLDWRKNTDIPVLVAF